MFKRLLCVHDFKLIEATKWRPSEATLHALTDEDERTLKIKCARCNKKKKVTQIKTKGEISNYLAFEEDE